MRNLRIVCLAVAALAGSTAALADPPTGSRLGDHRRPGPTLTAADQAAGAKRLAECLYNRRNELARATLLASTKEAADAAQDKLRAEVQCFGMVMSNDLVEERRVHIPSDLLRGMLAEAALKSSRAKVEALPALPLQRVYERSWYAITGRNVTVDEMGACIADTNPGAIVKLIGSAPMSKQEGEAFAGLGDSLGKCLRIGAKLHASRQALRAALADALYQRLNAPAPAPVVEAAQK